MKYISPIILLILVTVACKKVEILTPPEEEELIQFPIFDSGDQTYGSMKGIRNLDEWEAGAYAYYESDSTFAIGGYTTSPYWFGDTLIREHLIIKNIPLENGNFLILDNQDLLPHANAAKGKFSAKTDDDVIYLYPVDTTWFWKNQIYISNLDTLQGLAKGIFSVKYRHRAPEHISTEGDFFPRIIQFEEVEFDVKFREF